MSRGSLPGRPRCDTTTPRPRPLRRRRQRPCFRRPSRGPPRVPGPGSGPAGPRLKDTSGMLVPLPRPRHPLRRADREDGSGTSPLPPRGRGEAATPTRRPARGTADPRGRVEGGRGDGVSRRSPSAERPPDVRISAVGRAVDMRTLYGPHSPLGRDAAALTMRPRRTPKSIPTTICSPPGCRSAPPSKTAAPSPIPRAVVTSPPRRTTTGARLR